MSLLLAPDFITAAWLLFSLFISSTSFCDIFDGYGWLIMGTGMWLKFLWLYCYRFCKVILGVSFWGRQRDKFWESSCFTSFGFFEFVQNFFVSIGVMLSSLARSGLSSNTRLTMMILERDWSKESERNTSYKEEKIAFNMLGVWVWRWVCLVCNWERERERERGWRGFFLAFRLLVWQMSFIYIRTGENMRVWNGRGAGPNLKGLDA